MSVENGNEITTPTIKTSEASERAVKPSKAFPRALVLVAIWAAMAAVSIVALLTQDDFASVKDLIIWLGVIGIFASWAGVSI